ncbi:hypothetical protein CIE15_000250 [Salmonella enterica subsp. enterica serovar Oranienburg]|nr:hypothetical protein [Salmonella enterica subsp. enterica serovar Oranienburg]
MEGKMPEKQISNLAKCIAAQLIDSGLLKTASELNISFSEFEKKLLKSTESGIIKFNREYNRRPPAGVRL